MLFQNMSAQSLSRALARTILIRCLAVAVAAGGLGSLPLAAPAQAPPRKPVAPKKPMSTTEVETLWKVANDALLVERIKQRGLDFTPSGEWLNVELPKVTGIPASRMPLSTEALREKIVALDPDEVAKDAPDLFNALKSAAQKHSESDMRPLVANHLMADKALVYDLFDPTNCRAFTLGKPTLSDSGSVGLPFFELTTSNVEKLVYVYFSQFKGKLVVSEIVTGPQVADLYMRDEQKLANSKLETMFRALNDGDQSGIKTLCTPALYEAIQTWGGNKHPGDRLTRGRVAAQVSVQSSVPLDQKSIRVVTKVSYPLSASRTITFLIDFERVDNELKVVRIRDSANKAIVYDPNVDNYLNRRYSLPDAPVPDARDVAMTEEDVFLPIEKLIAKATRALQYHDLPQISDLAQLFVESDPTSGEGFGLRAAADLMTHKTEDADKDAHRALELNGTAYFVVERYSHSERPFTVAVLAVSKSKMDVIPGPGFGSTETIPMASMNEAQFAKGNPIIQLRAGPFLKIRFKSADGKKITSYDFADYGTTCPSDPQKDPALIEMASNGTCGAASTNGQVSGAYNIPILTPQSWHEDLAIVADIINGLEPNGHK